MPHPEMTRAPIKVNKVSGIKFLQSMQQLRNFTLRKKSRLEVCSLKGREESNPVRRTV